MSKLLFIGDIVGEPGLAYLEAHLPALIAEHQPDFVIANAENSDITGPVLAGTSPQSTARLFALGVDLITGGNHSWDGANHAAVYEDPRVLRPLNYGKAAAGEGTAVVTKNGLKLSVINLISRTAAMPFADNPFGAMETQLEAWDAAGITSSLDLLLVDFHGESVTEKMMMAYMVDGIATAVLGTHTHVRTLDTQILPKGTAYCTDVGMTGPTGGIQGYRPERFIDLARTRLGSSHPFAWADGPVELGAVLITADGRKAVAIQRL